MANAHVSLPKPFASGNIHKWFVRFDVCSDANKWDDETKAVKLPTLLEGEALAAWLELSTEAKKTYAKTKKGANGSDDINELHYPGEVSAEENGPWRSAASVPARSKAAAGMPGLDSAAKEQLLLHQFVGGLPSAISKQLRATGNTTELRSTVERAKLLTALENEQQPPQ